MKNLAPQILRKRLLIDATYTVDLRAEDINRFLLELARALDLRVYSDPIVHATNGEGKEENQGFDAFAPLVDSGISLYVWTSSKFLSCLLYTCKDFSNEDAVAFTKDFFKTTELECEEF
jgi:S-adenosylmethionine decarboxylase